MKATLKQLIIVLSLLLSFSVLGQQHSDTLSKKEIRQLEKQKQKEADSIERAEARSKLLNMLIDSSFVLEATLIGVGSMGKDTPVSSRTNFFAISGDDIVFQVAFAGRLGINGLGGVTNTGTLISYSIDSRKSNKPIFINGKIRPNPGTILIPFEISIQDNGAAQFYISTANGERIMLSGFIKSLAGSKVFEGTPYFR
ncbi:MAG: DUF4251 domain-containing protein [Bacteroidales bacterium]|jgi:hypothetical protein|nr:DUF4251 domain-containing protein [Bacteroidales bacterium]